jgi:uncharacterized repeat protein (TIGR03943 family)
VQRWQGAVLVVAALVSTVWLAITNQLILYIHPRYIVFTVIMAVIGLALVVFSTVNGHDHDHEEDEPRRFGRLLSMGGTVLTLLLAVGLVIVPPATLTTATADQRVINSGQTTGSTSVGSGAAAPSGASARFTVADWASLLRQTSDETFYRNKAADVVGTVNADKGDPDNVFFVSRFVITCCAVDAQPIGVPVYLPGWKNTFTSGEWVHVKGSFDTDPSSTSAQPIVLLPTSTVKTTQPSDPYLY